MAPAVIVRDVGKQYTLRAAARPNTLKNFALSRQTAQKPKRIWGLRHVSFTLEGGRALGVIGANGAGKSTLLRLVGGVGKPDEGEIIVKGRVGAILEIQAGLTDDLSGRENIFLAGVIAGMTRAEIAARYEAIVEFSGLKDHIDNPIRTYSTGMRMRLAFSVASHTEPDILLIDEALAVGDAAFQRRCFDRIRDIKNGGCAVMLVSHEASQIRSLCDEILLLKKGAVVGAGGVEEVLSLYDAQQAEAYAQDQEAYESVSAQARDRGLQRDVNWFGNGAALISDVRLQRGGADVTSIAGGDPLSIAFAVRAVAPMRDAMALAAIYAPGASPCFEAHAPLHAEPGAPAAWRVALDIGRLDLAAGPYHVTVGVFSSDWNTVYDYHAEAYPLIVRGAEASKGYLAPPHDWRVTPGGA